MRSRIQPGDGDPRHGTCNGYTNLRCRCQLCRDVWAAYIRRRKAERVSEAESMTLSHGKPTTYANWSCRCEDCTMAWRDYERAWRRARRKASA